MDINELSREELEVLLRQVYARIEQLELDERDAQRDRTDRISEAVSALDTLLGPVDAQPGTGSIRAVRGYDGATMAQHAEVALPLAFQGLEMLADVVHDIAVTLSTPNAST